MRIVLAVVLASLLVGCGGEDDGPLVVRVWHQKDGAERELLDEWVARYNTSQDTVRVETLYKETEELRNHYVFAAIGDKGPALVYGPADNLGTLGVTETIRPLDGLLPPAFLAGISDDGLLEWDGHLVMVADQVGNHLTYVYNRDLIPTPPATLAELIAQGQRLAVDNNGDGRPDRYALAWNYTEPFFFIPFLTSFGGWVMDDEGNPTLDNAATIKAIQFVLDLRDKYQIIPRESDYETVKMLFREGESAAVIDGSWSWASYSEAGVNMALAPIPRNEQTGLWAAPMVAAKGYAVNPAVSDRDLPAVLGVLQYLTGEPIQRAMADRLSTIPVQRSIRESALMERPILAASLRQIELGRPMPTLPQMRQIWDAMRGPYQLVMNGAVTPEAAARMMQDAAERRIADTFLD